MGVLNEKRCKSSEPERRAKAIVQAVTHYNHPVVLEEVSRDLGIRLF